MIIKLAKTAGFCFGVKNIDKLAEKSIRNKEKVSSYGPLIHNDDYVKMRLEEGLNIKNNIEQVQSMKTDESLILRAHGVKKEEKEIFENQGIKVIDGTCPVLKNIYKKTVSMNNNGRKVVIIGDENHPEIIAMKSYLDEDTIIVNSDEDVTNNIEFLKNNNIYVISQTTNRKEKFDNLVNIILNYNENAIIDNTICNATRDRQEECKQLAKECEAMIVIGGKKSSNSIKLAEVAKKYCKNTYFIQNFSDLALQELYKFNIIGVTAGASTPTPIIEEVVERMNNFSEEFMKAVNEGMVKIYPRDIVKGTVITVKEDEVYVDIKYRADGIVKTDEMTDSERRDVFGSFKEGAEVDVFVIKLSDDDGNVVLSTRRVEGLKNWQKLVEKASSEETVEAKVIGENSGGLTVNVMGINGFIPASQITTHFVKSFKPYLGETLECKIISIDERKRRVVLSSRAAKLEQREDVWDNIIVGETVKGKVARITPFGAFIDLGGIDGLIHVSDLSWDRAATPADVLTVGQEVEPVVIKLNREKNRISLGLKQLQPEPYALFKEKNKVGDVLKGTVVNITEFGVFVRLEEGVEGLIHISQISNKHIEKPSDELKVGDEIEVKVVELDDERQRIALSRKALLESEAKAKQTEERAQKFKEKVEQAERSKEKKAKSEKKQERKETKKQEVLSFDGESDLGTNLGELISLKLEEENSEPTEETVVATEDAE